MSTTASAEKGTPPPFRMPSLHTDVPESVGEIEVMEASERGSNMMPIAPKVLICAGQISEQLRSPCPSSQIFIAFFKSSGNKETLSISFPFPGREQCTIKARLCFNNVVSSLSCIGLTQLKKLVSSTHAAVNECLSHSTQSQKFTEFINCQTDFSAPSMSGRFRVAVCNG